MTFETPWRPGAVTYISVLDGVLEDSGPVDGVLHVVVDEFVQYWCGEAVE